MVDGLLLMVKEEAERLSHKVEISYDKMVYWNTPRLIVSVPRRGNKHIIFTMIDDETLGCVVKYKDYFKNTKYKVLRHIIAMINDPQYTPEIIRNNVRVLLLGRLTITNHYSQ